MLHFLHSSFSACYLVDLVLDSRSKGLGSIPTAGHVKNYQADISFHAAFAYSAVMGIWWMEIMSELRLKLPAYLYDVHTVFI